MPHALAMPSPGFQAVILCGPGVNFDTFCSKPEESPKALIPIANRPMVWYPMEFCYRMGVTNITLITPPASAPAIQHALSTNPHLTSLTPKPVLLAPKDLDQTTGTAQIFRLPEVQAAVTGDFIVLPCDVICELGGESLMEAWMIKEAGLGGATGGSSDGPKFAIGGERGGRRGGLGVWYSTKGENIVKGEETDFIAVTKLPDGQVTPGKGSLLPSISNLVYSMPTDTLNDITEDKKSLPLRHSLLRAHPRLRMLTSHRDAHIYIFPAWVMGMIAKNEHMENLSEDVIGWWAKSGRQAGLGEKLGLRSVLSEENENDADESSDTNNSWEEADIGSLSSTWIDSTKDNRQVGASKSDAAEQSPLIVPPILSYIHPSEVSSPIIRRVDTGPLLLSVSLQLAKSDSSPFAHASKISQQAKIAGKCSVSRADCLIAENTEISEKCAIKECVIGANCFIHEGAKLTRCVLMDNVVVGKGAKITGSILGRRSEIGADSVLQDCEVEDNLRIEKGTEAKAEKFKSSEGLEATEEEMADAFDDEADEAEEEGEF